MSDEFPKIQLGVLADITMEQSPDSINYNDDERGLAFLQGCADFGFRYPNPQTYVHPPLKLAKKDSVLVSVRAPVGKINWSDRDYCIGRGLCSVKAKENNADTSFLKYALIQNEKFLHRRSQGSTFLAISFNDLSIFPVPDITVTAQKKIALILETIDQTIEKTEALIQKYQQIKQGLMHDLFTRGVIPDGQLRPAREQAPELYKETPIGWIPKEWDVMNSHNIVTKIKRGPSLGTNLAGKGILYLTSDNINENGEIEWTTKKYLDTSSHTLSSTLEINDVLLNCVNSEAQIGKTGFVNQLIEKTTIGFNNFGIQFEKERITPKFGFYMMSNHKFQNALKKKIKPAINQVSFSASDLKNILCAFPESKNEQKAIIKFLDCQTEQIKSELLKKSKLKNQKLGLMHDLLTGKVRVKVDE